MEDENNELIRSKSMRDTFIFGSWKHRKSRNSARKFFKNTENDDKNSNM